MRKYDVLIIGGGFYGCCIALLAKRHFGRVAVVEAGDQVMGRASYANQARVHRGYHYPRSYLTASRSAEGFRRFVATYPDCVDRTAQHLYAIARESRVTATQFERFCAWVGAPLSPVSSHLADLFDKGMVEAVFAADEAVFNAKRLKSRIEGEMATAGVEVLLHQPVRSVAPAGCGIAVGTYSDEVITCKQAIACVYAGTNALLNRSGIPTLPLKHELAEMALLRLAPPLDNVGVTMVDGPFFSVLPFPARGLHTLTHVRYTPQLAWSDTRTEPAVAASQAAFMLADATRYLPHLRKSSLHGSLVEVKTVLQDSESNDGRPILLRQNYGFPRFTVTVGAKIDNVFDILEALGRQWGGETSDHEERHVEE